MRLFRVLLGLVLAGLTATSLTPPATAAPASVIIDSRETELVDAAGGGWTTKLGLTNLTTETITLEVPASGNCTPTLDRNNITIPEHLDVTVRIPAGCTLDDDRFRLTVIARAGSTVAEFDVTATAARPDRRIWWTLWIFPTTFALLCAFALAYLASWKPEGRGELSFPQKWKLTLRPDEKGWSFKDTWVTNITAGGALLTGIFGTAEVVTAFLGRDASEAIALAIVGAAISVAFIGAGTLVLGATQEGKDNTAGGFAFAAAVTLTGAVGQLVTVTVSAWQLDLGIQRYWLSVALLGALVLVVRYAYVTGKSALDEATKPTETAAPADATVKAAIETILGSIQYHKDVDQGTIDLVSESIAKGYPATRTSSGDEPPRRRFAPF